MFSFTGCLDNFSIPFLNLSASTPLRPITTPGLAVCISTVSVPPLSLLSISIRDTAALGSCCDRKSLI